MRLGFSQMTYFNKNGQTAYDGSFYQQVKAASGTNIDRCYQCLTCSLGCPVTFAMDYLPNQLVRMVQLGLKQPTLASTAIWVCADCETCATRCPNDVAIPQLMDALREMAQREGIRGKEKTVAAFHDAFLGNIKRWGRQYELPMLLELKLKAADFFSDIELGIKMLLKGKLKLLPPRFGDVRGVRAIFQRIEKRNMGGEQT